MPEQRHDPPHWLEVSDEGWGTADARCNLPEAVSPDETAEPSLNSEAHPSRRLPAWLQMLLVAILTNRRQVAIGLYAAVLAALFFAWLFGFSGLFR